MKIFKPPQFPTWNLKYKIFLGGSIEMGNASDWQNEITKSLADEDVYILNPRRDVWDSSWEQSINNPKFKEQVDWELLCLESSHSIVMYFDPNTKAPVSLLEFGLFAQTGKLIVCCPDGFWRKGNVDIVCKRYGVQQAETLSEVSKILKARINDRKLNY